MKESLKECPFCHDFPILSKVPLWRGSHGYVNSYDFYVMCDNEECLVKPKTMSYNTIYHSEKECRDLACAAWNKR